MRTLPDRGQLLASVKSVSGLVKCGVIGLNWLRKSQQSSAVAKGDRFVDRPAVSDLIDKCVIWTKIVVQSQQLHKPKNVMQLLPQQNVFRDATFLCTMNRLNPDAVMRYHGTPLGVLPIVSHQDRALVYLLIRSAHLSDTYIEGEQIHLNKTQTITALRT